MSPRPACPGPSCTGSAATGSNRCPTPSSGSTRGPRGIPIATRQPPPDSPPANPVRSAPRRGRLAGSRGPDPQPVRHRGVLRRCRIGSLAVSDACAAERDLDGDSVLPSAGVGRPNVRQPVCPGRGQRHRPGSGRLDFGLARSGRHDGDHSGHAGTRGQGAGLPGHHQPGHGGPHHPGRHPSANRHRRRHSLHNPRRCHPGGRIRAADTGRN